MHDKMPVQPIEIGESRSKLHTRLALVFSADLLSDDALNTRKVESPEAAPISLEESLVGLVVAYQELATEADCSRPTAGDNAAYVAIALQVHMTAAFILVVLQCILAGANSADLRKSQLS